MREWNIKRGRRFILYEADTPPPLLPCLQSRQPSLNSVDIDSGCSSNNKARDVVALWWEWEASFSTLWEQSRHEQKNIKDLTSCCSLLVTRDQMSAAIEIQRATSSIVTATELLRTTLSRPMRNLERRRNSANLIELPDQRSVQSRSFELSRSKFLQISSSIVIAIVLIR